MESQKKRKAKSICEYFERLDDTEGKIKAKCSHCSQACDEDGNVKQHSDGCKLNPNNLPIDSENRRRRKALVKMIILDQFPFLTVQSVEFKALTESLCPDFSIPSQLTVAKDCCEYFLEKKKKLRKLFTENKQRVCLAVSMWTSEEGLDYMCLSAQFIDDDWVLHNKIINFKPVPSDEGDEIGMTIIKCLEVWGIENVLTITMDNSSASDVAVSYLKRRLPNLFSGGKYLHVRCMTHFINLVVKEGFRSLNDTIERIRSAVRYLTISPEGLDKFKSCVAEKGLESKTFFRLDWPDRWNTTSDMLKRASEFEKAFELFETKDPDFKDYLENDDYIENDVPSRTDWTYARKFASLLEFFKRKATDISSTTYVVANQFFSEVMNFDAHLYKMSNEQEPRFKLMANTMSQMFDEYWGDQKKSCMMLYFAVILDPRMKLEIIKFGLTKMCNLKKAPNTEHEVVDKMVEDTVKDIADEFGLLFNEYELLYKTTNSDIPSNENFSQSDNSFFDDFLMSCRVGPSDTTTELQKYLNSATIPYNQEFDVLQWWKLNASRYPTLSKMAKDILAIPLSTVATESAFYTDKQVLSSDRSALPPLLIEALFVTHDWIRTSRKDVIKEEEDLSDVEFF
ncbi:hypothetical protein M8C21_005429 [Ambrosia artemisiifolia]|uniref:Zinc finger BED domain-containing protein RICESLEEPER 2-like n=1 Tax=Ambrosia artemisiifolia TaxID=4212 RepID=A0AAD5DEQ0_AMBAR|nr:hypothetical protein M8C21_005429 [Ambrosia artemisiifolia]